MNIAQIEISWIRDWVIIFMMFNSQSTTETQALEIIRLLDTPTLAFEGYGLSVVDIARLSAVNHECRASVSRGTSDACWVDALATLERDFPLVKKPTFDLSEGMASDEEDFDEFDDEDDEGFDDEDDEDLDDEDFDDEDYLDPDEDHTTEQQVDDIIYGDESTLPVGWYFITNSTGAVSGAQNGYHIPQARHLEILKERADEEGIMNMINFADADLNTLPAGGNFCFNAETGACTGACYPKIGPSIPTLAGSMCYVAWNPSTGRTPVDVRTLAEMWRYSDYDYSTDEEDENGYDGGDGDGLRAIMAGINFADADLSTLPENGHFTYADDDDDDVRTTTDATACTGAVFPCYPGVCRNWARVWWSPVYRLPEPEQEPDPEPEPESEFDYASEPDPDCAWVEPGTAYLKLGVVLKDPRCEVEWKESTAQIKFGLLLAYAQRILRVLELFHKDVGWFSLEFPDLISNTPKDMADTLHLQRNHPKRYDLLVKVAIAKLTEEAYFQYGSTFESTFVVALAVANWLGKGDSVISRFVRRSVNELIFRENAGSDQHIMELNGCVQRDCYSVKPEMVGDTVYASLHVLPLDLRAAAGADPGQTWQQAAPFEPLAENV
jgi:hypothetical protein